MDGDRLVKKKMYRHEVEGNIMRGRQGVKGDGIYWEKDPGRCEVDGACYEDVFWSGSLETFLP